MKPCNKCNKPFEATSPFNRTCETCTARNAKVSKRGRLSGSGLPNKHVAFSMNFVKEIPEVLALS